MRGTRSTPHQGRGPLGESRDVKQLWDDAEVG